MTGHFLTPCTQRLVKVMRPHGYGFLHHCCLTGKLESILNQVLIIQSLEDFCTLVDHALVDYTNDVDYLRALKNK
jgi:hypothetical protein